MSAIAWYFALTHLTNGIPLLRNLETFRFVIPLSIVALIGLCAGLISSLERLPALRGGFPFLFPSCSRWWPSSCGP